MSGIFQAARARINHIPVPSSGVLNGQVTTKTMPFYQGNDGQAVIANGLLYVVTGHNSTTSSNYSTASITGNFNSYDPSADTWAALPVLPTPSSYPGLCYDGGNYLCLFGGISGGSNKGMVWRYAIGTAVWDEIIVEGSANALPDLDAMAVAVAGGYVYIFGGVTGAGGVSNALYRYPLPLTGNDPPQLMASGPTARSCCTLTAIGDKLYLHGGAGAFGNPIYADLWEYDTTNNTWTQLPSSSIARQFHGAGAIGQYLYVCGSYDTSIQVYDTVGQTWSTIGTLPSIGHVINNLPAIGNSLYMLGNGGTTMSNTLTKIT